jgi:hypothetical protein
VRPQKARVATLEKPAMQSPKAHRTSRTVCKTDEKECALAHFGGVMLSVQALLAFYSTLLLQDGIDPALFWLR